MSDEASPRPWALVPEVDPAPMDAKGWPIVEGQVYSMTPANGRLIVRAVNHHDALVAALDDMLLYAEQFCDAGEHLTQFRTARALLARIEGEVKP